MNELVLNNPKGTTTINNFNIQIDWAELLRLRPETIVNEKVPPYLLLPEVRYCIEHAKTVEQSILFESMFVLGTRIGELMMLTKQSFNLVSNNQKKPHAVVPILKQRKKKIPNRLINLEPEYTAIIKQYLASIKRKPNEPIFNKSVRTYQNYFETINKHGFDIKVSSHTFRHSCAVHLVLLGFDVNFISKYLGHSNIESVQVYTKVALPLLQKTRPPVTFR